MRPMCCLWSLALTLILLHPAAADETSTHDKLRILYSNRFTFTNDGIPLVTVELMSGQSQISLSAQSGVIVRPDGEGASEILGESHWSISIENPRSATIREWTVVQSFDPDDDDGAAAILSLWQKRGYKSRLFEVGTVFAVDGAVIDTRELLVGIAPKPAGQGARFAEQIARSFHLTTRVHQELVRRPLGTIVASSSTTTVRNPSVIWFSPRDPNDTIVVANVLTGTGGSQLQTKREDRRYFGSIYVTVGSDGSLVAVNAVPATKLLAGLVPSEIYPDAPGAALAAQAIAARTELLHKIGTRHLSDPYLLCSNQHCQVYSGAGHEHPNTTAAVDSTRGLVLLRESGGLVDARYSASCGGFGEHNESIWDGPPDPALRGHLDTPSSSRPRFAGGISDANLQDFLSHPPANAFCANTRFSKGRFRWSKTISTTELSQRVATYYPDIGSVLALVPLERGTSGRIRKLQIRGTHGTTVVTGDLHIRRLLGGLRSSLFTVSSLGASQNPSGFEFHGAGFGHGVGMCQLGAIGMAQSGYSFLQILQHYYAGSRVQRIY